MASIPKILTNKTVISGLPASFSAGSIFKPVAGKAGAMGKLEAVATAAPKAGGIKGGFSPSLAISSGFQQFGSPTFVLKKPVVFR